MNNSKLMSKKSNSRASNLDVVLTSWSATTLLQRIASRVRVPCNHRISLQDVNKDLILESTVSTSDALVAFACDKAVDDLQTLLDLFSLFGFDVISFRESRAYYLSLARFAILHVHDKFVEYMKYQTAYCFIWGAVLPGDTAEYPMLPKFLTKPSPYLVGGSFFLWIRKWRFHNLRVSDDTSITSKRSQSRSLFQSILQLKKGLSRPSEELLDKAVNDFSKLSLPPKDFSSNEEGEGFISEVRRTVREVFTGHKFSYDGFIVPSAKSHYGWNSKKRGALGAIMSSRTKLFKIPETFECFTWEEECIESKVLDLNSCASADGEFCELVSNVKKNIETEFKVLPVGLLEPLKVRVISKGPVHAYYLCKWVQRFMWGVTRSHPSFCLIGEPLTSNLLNDRLGIDLPDDWSWNSADYKGATDNTDSRLSEAACDEIARVTGMDDFTRALLIDSLVNHLIPQIDGSFLPQRNGQLMGSPSSFPILCLVNAAITRMVLEHYYGTGGVLSLRDCHMLINGDDLLVPMPTALYPKWKQYTLRAGLIPSIGKNYLSRSFVVINSQMYQYGEFFQDESGSVLSTSGISLRFQRVPFVNMGLLKGLSRSGEIDEVGVDASGRTLGARAEKLLAMGPTDRKEELLSLFIRYNRRTLNSFPSYISWWVPEQFGGVGLPILDFKVLKSQPAHLRAIGRMIDDCFSCSIYRGGDCDEIHSLEQRFAKKIGSKWSGGEEAKGFTSWCGLLFLLGGQLAEKGASKLRIYGRDYRKILDSSFGRYREASYSELINCKKLKPVLNIDSLSHSTSNIQLGQSFLDLPCWD